MVAGGIASPCATPKPDVRLSPHPAFQHEGLSIFARYGATDFRPRWAARRDGTRETPAEKVVDVMRSLRLV